MLGFLLCDLCALCALCVNSFFCILPHDRQKGYRANATTQSPSQPHTSYLAGKGMPPPKMPLARLAWQSGSTNPVESAPCHETRAPHGKSRGPCVAPPALLETRDSS